MARKRTRVKRNQQDVQPEIPKLPDKERLYVTEVAEVLARKDGITLQGARMRIYRGIENGRVRCVRVLGALMIPRTEAERIVEGDTP